MGACACEVAVPHERRTMADICSELSRRLSSRRKSRPVKTVLSEERIWKVDWSSEESPERSGPSDSSPADLP